MEIPDLSMQDARSLIVNTEQSIFNGKHISNKKPPLRTCKKCNISMPGWVKFCPKCAMEMAVKVDLNQDKQTKINYKQRVDAFFKAFTEDDWFFVVLSILVINLACLIIGKYFL